MPVPDYQTLMAPCLRALEDGQTRTIHEIRGRVSAEIGITDQDKQEMIKSGISVFDSRTARAVTYIAQAGLIRRPRRAIHQITERGLQVLGDHPDRVDNHLLAQFEEFREFKARARATQSRSNAGSSPFGPDIISFRDRDWLRIRRVKPSGSRRQEQRSSCVRNPRTSPRSRSGLPREVGAQGLLTARRAGLRGAKEVELIRVHRSNDPAIGYNPLAEGGLRR
jgi:hypothetical protein